MVQDAIYVVPPPLDGLQIRRYTSSGAISMKRFVTFASPMVLSLLAVTAFAQTTAATQAAGPDWTEGLYWKIPLGLGCGLVVGVVVPGQETQRRQEVIRAPHAPRRRKLLAFAGWPRPRHRVTPARRGPCRPPARYPQFTPTFQEHTLRIERPYGHDPLREALRRPMPVAGGSAHEVAGFGGEQHGVGLANRFVVKRRKSEGRGDGREHPVLNLIKGPHSHRGMDVQKAFDGATHIGQIGIPGIMHEAPEG